MKRHTRPFAGNTAFGHRGGRAWSLWLEWFVQHFVGGCLEQRRDERRRKNRRHRHPADGRRAAVARSGPGLHDPGRRGQWVAYTGLTTYAHANGVPGSELIPGLATALPTISNGGKTYTVTLRKGLMYSNGEPVKASDFAYTVERALKIPWGGSAPS